MHIGADLREDDFGKATTDPWNGHQVSDQGLKRAQTLGNLLVEVSNGLIEGINEGQLLGDEKPMMGFEPASQRLLKQIAFAAQLAPGQRCQRGGVSSASEQMMEDIGGRNAGEVLDHRRELDVGILQDLLQPQDGASTILDQATAVASQVAEFTLRGIGDKAGTKQAMLQQIGEPFGIADIGFASWNAFDMLGIDEHNLDSAFQHVTQAIQIGKHGREGAALFVALTLLVGGDQTGHDALFVDVESCTTGIEYVHETPPQRKQAQSNAQETRESGCR